MRNKKSQATFMQKMENKMDNMKYEVSTEMGLNKAAKTERKQNQ